NRSRDTRESSLRESAGVSMATYNFSALSNGQAISFNPNSDVLNFDQTAISAGNLQVDLQGSDSRTTVLSGTDAGKSITLLNTAPPQLATSNVHFANASALLFGDNSPSTAGDDLANSIDGTAGADLIQGFGGNDALFGGGGADRVLGGAGNDTVSGNDGNEWIEGGAGDDTVDGGSGQDRLAVPGFVAATAGVLHDFAGHWDTHADAVRQRHQRHIRQRFARRHGGQRHYQRPRR